MSIRASTSAYAWLERPTPAYDVFSLIWQVFPSERCPMTLEGSSNLEARKRRVLKREVEVEVHVIVFLLWHAASNLSEVKEKLDCRNEDKGSKKRTVNLATNSTHTFFWNTLGRKEDLCV